MRNPIDASQPQWEQYVQKLRNCGSQEQREEWADRQPPLIDALDPQDAPDDQNP